MDSKVWSVTIKGQNDCVVLTDFEAMQVKMKFMPDIEMYDMTERHGLKPAHLHKLDRKKQSIPSLTWVGPGPEPTYTKGVGPGMFGGAADMIWEFKDLMEMEV